MVEHRIEASTELVRFQFEAILCILLYILYSYFIFHKVGEFPSHNSFYSIVETNLQITNDKLLKLYCCSYLIYTEQI